MSNPSSPRSAKAGLASSTRTKAGLILATVCTVASVISTLGAVATAAVVSWLVMRSSGRDGVEIGDPAGSPSGFR